MDSMTDTTLRRLIIEELLRQRATLDVAIGLLEAEEEKEWADEDPC
ncbi:hypothetical protein SDC9_108175 [bioreactor metagenome]|uniref:Uncharacterized protein n=1 Tax=bioreactor metagenome TaxID=1076179 RepID=A0A645B7E6_9ZZZZ